MHYGKVTVRLKTASKVGGIVTSFITMADNKDEIDFEVKCFFIKILFS